MSVTVKVNWSGGKDSTCAVLEHLKEGHHVKAVCYVPMFTDFIPLIQKAHYIHLQRCAALFRGMGAEVYFVSGLTYWDYVTSICKRGKFKGKIKGFPYVGHGHCGFKRDSKLVALNSVDVGYYDYEDIGIAVDEVRRYGSLSDLKRSILVDHCLTELDCRDICAKNGVLSPQYNYSYRDGCVLCPYAKDDELNQWLADYPDALELLIKLQDIVFSSRPDRMPPRIGYRWFVDDEHEQEDSSCYS